MFLSYSCFCRDFRNEKISKNILCIFCLLILFINSSVAQTFNIEESPAPLFRDPIFDGSADPSIIWNQEAKEWWIFYTQRRANVKCQGVAWCFGTAIGIAGSKDNGKSWYYKGTAQGLDFDKGHNTFWAPDILLDENGCYHMFVTYTRGVYHYWGGIPEIVHLTSTNLIDWKPASNPNLIEFIDPDTQSFNQISLIENDSLSS